ncbi:hypothetical protein RHMOL_Rhmol04G0025500 [Rhododendron molle]|uniref:Uncharacterized protein n=1 Tax=Rhododendron molle TaxID=49168 RepID=A0ACC0NYN4_RHOML|nr:hypothetical protein RHMOL_Rhmol04G0025500 [Rhododendron molle]
MVSTHKLKSVDFYRKIPRDLTEASLSGAGLSIVAAFSMIFLFGMELNNYFTISTSTSVVVDKSSDGEFLRIEFNFSFPALSCEFASVDVSDVLGTNRLNITKTIRKYPINSDLKPTGSEFHSGPISKDIKHDDEADEQHAGGSASLDARNFDIVAHKHQILVVNFFAPWCYWSNRLKPSWDKAARIIRERYDPEVDGRILLGKVDCTEEVDLCKRHHIQGYPSIRIFRKGSDVRDDHGHHDHESYYGDRDTDTLVKVPGSLVISARSGSHSFDASKMNMSHIISHLSFGKKISPAAMRDMKRVLPYLGVSHDKLNGRDYIIHPGDSNADVTIEHYLQVVKTEVIMRSYREQLVEYEYTAHSSLVHSIDLPVAKFHFELSPMQVLITENSKSFSHFITNICAIIGGVFTVAGILDSILHNTMRLVKKVELGKNF